MYSAVLFLPVSISLLSVKTNFFLSGSSSMGSYRSGYIPFLSFSSSFWVSRRRCVSYSIYWLSWKFPFRFFVLSGFLISLVLENKEVAISTYINFYFKRTRRIFPLLLLVRAYSHWTNKAIQSDRLYFSAPFIHSCTMETHSLCTGDKPFLDFAKCSFPVKSQLYMLHYLWQTWKEETKEKTISEM